MSGVKIKAAAGGGSTELQGPASTADNTVLKLPSNIVADQFLTTDSNGAMSWAEAGGGKILQLQYATTTTSQKEHQTHQIRKFQIDVRMSEIIYTGCSDIRPQKCGPCTQRRGILKLMFIQNFPGNKYNNDQL